MSVYAVAVLLSYALAAGWGVDRLLARARWVSRYPRHALFAWHASALACLGAVTGVSLLLAHDVLEHGLLWLLHADKGELHLAYAGGRSVDGLWNAAALLPIAVLISMLVVVTSKAIADERRRRQFRLLPRTAKRFGSDSTVGVAVVDHAVPAAHCLPGRRGRGLIVLTSAALTQLTATELEAALEHERAHLHLHHHRMILIADSISAILARTGALRSYPAQVRRLVELDADDVAVRRFGHQTVASALLAMCTPPPHPATDVRGLSFSGSAAAVRIRRLLETDDSEHPLRAAPRVLLTWSIPLALLLPPAIVLWPAASLVGSAH
ncbi:M56 family metallopeptidase [Nocardioides pyridinolyticus]